MNYPSALFLVFSDAFPAYRLLLSKERKWLLRQVRQATYRLVQPDCHLWIIDSTSEKKEQYELSLIHILSGMVILKYELKRHRKYILGWAIALALCVFVMTPTYYSFMDVSTGDLYETLGTSDFYKGVGVSMEYLTSPCLLYTSTWQEG